MLYNNCLLYLFWLKQSIEEIVKAKMLFIHLFIIYYNKCEGKCLKRVPLTKTHSHKCYLLFENCLKLMAFHIS